MGRSGVVAIALCLSVASVYAASPGDDVFGEIEAMNTSPDGPLPAAFVKDNENLSPLVRQAQTGEASRNKLSQSEAGRIQNELQKEQEDARVHDITDYASIPGVTPIAAMDTNEVALPTADELKKRQSAWGSFTKSEALVKAENPMEDAAKALDGFKKEAKAALMSNAAHVHKARTPEDREAELEAEVTSPWHHAERTALPHIDSKMASALHKRLRDAHNMPHRHH